MNLQPNGFDGVYLYSLESGKSVQVTDAMADAGTPTFSADGKYIFFPASTNSGMAISGLHMQTYEESDVQHLRGTAVKSTPPSSPLKAMKKR